MVRWLRAALWLSSCIALGALVVEPISVKTQLFVALSGVLVMMLIRGLGLVGVWRHIFIAIGVGLSLRYLFWRSVNTLPPVSDPIDFVPGILLYIGELYSAMMLAISLFVVIDPLERAPAPKLETRDLPTVDVFVPTYNEDPELLAMTLIAAMEMDYPREKFTVWTLDDGGTDQKCNQPDAAKAHEARERRVLLTELSTELGARYLTRARNEHAKAGNLNNGLVASNGELVVVFDADHVPDRSFLQRTVGHFRRDPRLFLCQTPHVFTNPDPIERNLDTYAVMPSENEMFYGIIQKGLDKWNGAFFCGSAAVVRRAALEEVGGFSGITITEDCETALDLHSRGWNSCYIDEPLISGLQPDTFASFIGQRSRWARGMFQIFLLKNPLFKRGLSWAQKICYLSSMTFWFFPLFRVPFLFAPLMFIYFNMQIYVANIQEFFAYTMMYLAANMMMQNYLYGQVRWPLVSEIYEFVQTLFLSRGLLTVLLNPRKPTFNVTDKGLGLDKDRLSELSMPFFVIFSIYAVSMLVCVWRWFTEGDANELLVVVAGWNFYNLLLSGAALGVISERRENRRDIDRPARLAIGAAFAPARVNDVSYGGCRVSLEGHPAMPSPQIGALAVLDVDIRDAPGSWQSLPVQVKHVTHKHGRMSIGFAFVDMKQRHYRAVKDLMFAEAAEIESFRLARRKRQGVLTGLFMLTRWGILGPLRSLKLLRDNFAAQRARNLRRPPTSTDTRPQEVGASGDRSKTAAVG